MAREMSNVVLVPVERRIQRPIQLSIVHVLSIRGRACVVVDTDADVADIRPCEVVRVMDESVPLKFQEHSALNIFIWRGGSGLRFTWRGRAIVS